MTRRLAALRALVLGTLATTLTGCPDPNLYGGPRTLPRGKSRIVASGQGLVVRENAQGNAESVSGGGGVDIHHGIADRLEIGARVASTGLRADLKWNFIRGDLDLAIDPAVQFGALGKGSYGLFGHLPLVVGVNLGEALTFYATPGVAFLTRGGSNVENGAVTKGGVAARIGAGFEWRLTKSVAVIPEVTVMRFFDGSEASTLNFGLGLAFGAQANYGTSTASVVQWEEDTRSDPPPQEVVPEDESSQNGLPSPPP